ncbi:response regulator [Azospirillum sp. sgz302134]
MAAERFEIPILLIVDDDELVLSSLQAFFSASGYETLASSRILEALSVCRRFKIIPAAAIINFHLNDGFTFEERIGAIKDCIPETPIAVLTGDTSEETAAKVKSGGFSLLCKPTPPTLIMDYIGGLVRLGHMRVQGSPH